MCANFDLVVGPFATKKLHATNRQDTQGAIKISAMAEMGGRPANNKKNFLL